ncbi:phytase [Flavobacterium selenitireducens]|uniref:phytase n=1 Tax=Flavobacterium selenitireducens TaxID=2722704 RepID=UPI00168BF9B4|nr:phytase [Flavobacterium selenitireducens]MBD3584086.1 phytase [Flavobacterium selenitireducens]
MKKIVYIGFAVTVSACSGSKLAAVRPDAVAPTVVTQKTPHDTDDPAIWVDPKNPSASLIIGTDKDSDGGLYVYDLSGKIIRKSIPLKRPNNVDVAYGLEISGQKTDIVATTERETNSLRVFSLPDLTPVDNGGIALFDGETERSPMGIAFYTSENGKIYAIVGRKTGPSEHYLWQYELSDSGNGGVKASVVRKFGKFSGKKEIEAIAVDNEAKFVYCSDETVGIRKYYADPKASNEELAFFGQTGFASDHEGIAIYKTGEKTGYILISNQQANTFMVYPREGIPGKPNEHPLLAEVPVSTIECDGADAISLPLNSVFPQGFLVAMSNGMVFHLYDWRQIQQRIDAQRN